MLTLLRATTLGLLAGVWWGAPYAAEALKSPQNVEVSIIDDNITLKWETGGDHDGNVTFSAYYQIPLLVNWTELPGCQHTAALGCSVASDALEELLEETQVRVRAEKGKETSPWYEVESFVPFVEAQIGPPTAKLEAEDKALFVYIFPPGTEESAMWATEHFKYQLVIWSDSSVQQSMESINPNYSIYNLSPQTTYCLKVRATLPSMGKVGFYSPVHCINTTVRNELPAPENIQVDAGNQSYVLQWDYPHHPAGAVAFRAQWLPAYLKLLPGNHSNEWKQIRDCELVNSTRCVIPRTVFHTGIHLIRVQASQGNATSFWSEEKTFDTDLLIVIHPPVIDMKPINEGSLRIYIGSPKYPKEKSVEQDYPLTYETIFWESSSNTQKKYHRKSDFTIDKLKTLTVYCAKVRAILEDVKWNKTSEWSNIRCQETKPGNIYNMSLILGLCIAFILIIVAPFLVKALWKYVKYVFFPSSKPPSTMNEDFSEKALKNLLFVTSEEETEKCFVIENMDSVTSLDDVHRGAGSPKQYSSQTSEDSGNYSNEDETSENQAGVPERESKQCDQK